MGNEKMEWLVQVKLYKGAYGTTDLFETRVKMRGHAMRVVQDFCIDAENQARVVREIVITHVEER